MSNSEVYEFNSLGGLKRFLNGFTRIDLDKVKCPIRLYWDEVEHPSGDEHLNQHQVVLVTSEAE